MAERTAGTTAPPTARLWTGSDFASIPFAARQKPTLAAVARSLFVGPLSSSVPPGPPRRPASHQRLFIATGGRQRLCTGSVDGFFLRMVVTGEAAREKEESSDPRADGPDTLAPPKQRWGEMFYLSGFGNITSGVASSLTYQEFPTMVTGKATIRTTSCSDVFIGTPLLHLPVVFSFPS